MILFHKQVLINFTYHVGYKPIFMSRESHLLIKGAKNRNTFIMDPNSQFLPSSPLNVCGAILKRVNEQLWMWEIRVSRHVRFKIENKSMPSMQLLFTL